MGERAAGRSLLSLGELVDELVQEQDFLDALADQEDELSDVRAVFSWSYRALPEESRRAFRLLGLHEGKVLCVDSAAALLAVTPAVARRRLGELANVHLLQETARDRYRMHDLLRSYAVELLSAEEPREERTRAVRRVLTWYLLSADAGRKAILPRSRSLHLVPAGDQVRPVERFDEAADAVRWFDTERENLLAALRQAVAWGQYDIAWMLPAVASGFFELSAHWSDWKHVHELGLDAARLVGSRLGEAFNLLCLGMCTGGPERTTSPSRTTGRLRSSAGASTISGRWASRCAAWGWWPWSRAILTPRRRHTSRPRCPCSVSTATGGARA